MFRSLLALLVLVSYSAVSRADLDPERNSRYQLQVVLQVARHPNLTPVYKNRVALELKDDLQPLAGLADIKVDELDALAKKYPQLKDVETRGLQKALDGWHFIENIKFHFVWIDYVNGQYQVQARQYDGLTGLPSPIVRERWTAERLLVAKEAAQLVEEDFGLVGTVPSDLREGKVEVTLKGSDPDVDLGRWVQKGDVFEVAGILRQGNSDVSSRLNSVLLWVEEGPKNGTCHCRVLHRYQLPSPSQVYGLLGYRCLKLGTAEARLHLRVVSDPSYGTPFPGAQVTISDPVEPGRPVETDRTLPDGRFDSHRSYKNVALVTISDRGQALTGQIPVALFPDRTVVLVVARQQGAEVATLLNYQRDRWIRHVVDSLEVAAAIVKDLNAETSYQKAQDKAEQGLKTLDEDLRNLKDELKNLKEMAGKKPLDLGGADKQLEDLKLRRDELEAYMGKLKDILAKEKDPKHQQWKQMALRANQLENDGDYPQAIKLYEEIVSQGGADESVKPVKEHLDKLKKEWEPRGKKHEEARAFIYDTWPGVDNASQMKAQLPKAQEAFKTCESVGDTLTPVKLLKANLQHATKLKQEVDELHPEENEDDRTTAKTIKEVNDGLDQLNKSITKYLESKPKNR